MLDEGNLNGWVFCDTQGGPIRKSNLLRRSFKPLLKKAGLPPIRFHDLRHTCATLLLTQGVPLRVVQEILGHTLFSTTADIYAHVLPVLMADAADKMNNALTYA